MERYTTTSGHWHCVIDIKTVWHTPPPEGNTLQTTLLHTFVLITYFGYTYKSTNPPNHVFSWRVILQIPDSLTAHVRQCAVTSGSGGDCHYSVNALVHVSFEIHWSLYPSYEIMSLRDLRCDRELAWKSTLWHALMHVVVLTRAVCCNGEMAVWMPFRVNA